VTTCVDLKRQIGDMRQHKVKQIGKKWVDCCANTNENITPHNTDNDNMAKTT